MRERVGVRVGVRSATGPASPLDGGGRGPTPYPRTPPRIPATWACAVGAGLCPRSGLRGPRHRPPLDLQEVRAGGVAAGARQPSGRLTGLRPGRAGAGLPWSRPSRPRPPGKVSCVGAAAGSAESGAQSGAAPSAAGPGVSAPAGVCRARSPVCHPRFALRPKADLGTPTQLDQWMRLSLLARRVSGLGGGHGGDEAEEGVEEREKEEEDGELTAANY